MVDPLIFCSILLVGIIISNEITNIQNPVYSGLYLVLLFVWGSCVCFLFGLEFIAILFLLVYAGAIAVLVLFVVMMLDVKGIEIPWSVRKKKLLFNFSLVFIFSLSFTQKFFVWIKNWLKKSFDFLLNLQDERMSRGYTKDIIKEVEARNKFYEDEGLKELLYFEKKNIEDSYVTGWFVNFDFYDPLIDISHVLYSTYAILLIIAGIILLIAMVGAISLTIQKSSPESLFIQLSRQSQNAVFFVSNKNR